MNTGRDEDALARDLDELDAIRRRVINVVGHSLRTPVTTIAGMAQALGRASDEATRTLLAEGLARNARRLEILLDDLLLAAGVTTALPAGEARPTSVASTFADEWSALGEPGGLAVEGPSLAPVIRATSLAQIARILLDNALKYGDGTVRVANNATPSGGVCVDVESTGDTPSDDEIAHAFELFYRGEHAVMTTPGLGIGLPVARVLAKAEGGDVRLARRGAAVVATVELSA